MLKTTTDKLINVEELSWENTLTLLDKATPKLAAVVKDIPPALRYPFYKASYRFGEQIINKNGVYLPLADDEPILLNDDTLPQILKENLGYAAHVQLPIGLLVNNNCEFYLQNSSKITPYTTLKPGNVFGISNNSTKDNLASHSLWDLTAGARSIFMLAKISNTPQHNILRKSYDLSSRPPRDYTDHWAVFKELALKANSQWRTEILFFDNRWAKLLADEKYLPLKAQLLALQESEAWHHQPNWNLTLGQIEVARALTSYSSEILDAAKHIFSIAAGLFPGFAPAMNETSAPIELIQKAYTEVYELEQAPIIMEPAALHANDKLPVFYSLNYPSSPKSTPTDTNNRKSVISNLSILMEVLKNYQLHLTEEPEFRNQLRIRALSLLNAMTHTKFSFYDNEYSSYKGINDPATLPLEDPRFACNKKNQPFPVHGAFLKGLVSISLAEK
ncbi:MAG: hypothetical protein KBD37_00040 [Burkholderiales bacterium]|nr:hypothetical protein [Burkholderiales bacterium]